ncbi:DUF6063 family protein [Alkaliphilus transvaalensis]|uniref:DUF6063 family protein n=1 Tax=Alkaliphilus transvaalensis TaxID=114628 RepID=UPI0004787C5E|nr:DUF6063 family protein [Alkaliphilus transvaalensis]
MYDMQSISRAMKIYYYLLQNKELSIDDNKELYRYYTEDENIINILSIYAEESDCFIERYNGVIYLLPKEDNQFIGFSKTELKKILCRSNPSYKDFYLSQYIILSVLTTFYNSNGRSSKSRNFIKFGDFMNVISDSLKNASEVDELEGLENKSGMAIRNIYEAWNALKGSDTKTTSKSTKEGIVRGVIKFLDEQKLLEFIEEDDMIKPTPKLDNFMDWNILNRSNYDTIIKAFEEAEIIL